MARWLGVLARYLANLARCLAKLARWWLGGEIGINFLPRLDEKQKYLTIFFSKIHLLPVADPRKGRDEAIAMNR